MFGINEFKKWDNLGNAAVIIRTTDYVTFDTSVIANFNGNTVTLESPLSFVPSAGMVLELDIYDNQPDEVKLLYTFMNDGPTFDDDGPLYLMF